MMFTDSDDKPQPLEKEQAETLDSEIDEALRRSDVLPTVDPRPADEILGYDENGLPS